MFDYVEAVKQTYNNFLTKQQDYMAITLINDTTIDTYMTSINNLYLLKFDPQYQLRTIEFIPPDFPEEISVFQGNLLALFDKQEDIPYVKRFLVELDNMSRLYPALQSLFNIALFRKE